MEIPSWSCFLVLMVNTICGDFDVNFCNSHLGRIDVDGANEPPPVFFDDFSVFIEQKSLGEAMVTNIEEYYSQHAGLVHVNFMRKNGPAKVWVDIKYNEVMVVPTDSSSCSDSQFAGSDEYWLFGATTNEKDVTTLSDPSIALHWGGPFRMNISYKGQDVLRGITTQKWWTCEYAQYRDATTFTEWQIVDPSINYLPVVHLTQPRPILPVSALVIGVDKKDSNNIFNFTYRYDFTHFDNISPYNSHFRIPPTMMCAKKPNSQQPLPLIPDFFRFRGEMLTILNYNTLQPSTPLLVYSIEEYRHALGWFIQDVISSTTDTKGINSKSYLRLVDDFNTGLSYTLDLISGFCEINVIMDDTVDAIRMANGLVTMRDSQQFFDLDPKAYQFMGQQEFRGITCDVWTAYFGSDQTIHQKNAYYTWYFANPDWMKNNGYQQPFAMPVAVELRKDSTYVQFNLFEFTTSINRNIPDLSTCFDVNNVINAQIIFNASYSEFYTEAEAGFQQSFLIGLTQVTSLNSTLRIADLDVQPTADNNIMVRFKLLDKPSVKGDVQHIPVMASNQRVLQEIQDSINNGKFSINAGETGNVILYAIPNTATQITARPHTATQLTARPTQLLSSTTTSTASQTKPAGYVSTTQATTGPSQQLPISTQPTKLPTKSTGFNSGEMAGVAVGMLVTGLLLGALVIFLIKRKNERINQDISMKTLSSSDD